MDQNPSNSMKTAGDIIQETWTEIGTSVRALSRTVFVRTDPPEEKTPSGLLFFPATESSFYDGPMHLRFVKALVLSVGPKATLKSGERVCFQRQYFSRWKILEDKSFVGWIDETQITATIEDTEVSRFIEYPGGPKQAKDRPV